MKALAFVSERDCESNTSEIHQLKRRISSLQAEADLLNRIIYVNQTTLEEINQHLLRQLQNSENFSISDLISQSNSKEIYTSKKERKEVTLHPQISKQIDEIVQTHFHNFRITYQNLLIDHNDQVNKLKKTLRLDCNRKSKEINDCDTSIEQYTSGKAIFQIPIQVQLLKEVMDREVQVDLSASFRDYIYQVPIEMHQIFQIPVELNRIFQVPVQITTEGDVKNRIYEVPVEIQQVIDIDSDYQIDKIICQMPVFQESKDISAINNIQMHQLKQKIQRLTLELDNLKTSKRKIYQVPVELQPLSQEQLNSQQSYIQVPVQILIDSQQNLQGLTLNQDKIVSIKYVQSKISTQVNTQSDLDQSPFKPQLTEYQKHSIIVNSPNPIQQTEEISSNIHQQSLKSMSPQKRISFDQIEMSQQSVQTDFEIQIFKKESYVKIPVLKTIEVPYQVQKIIERIVKIPVLKIIQVPVQIPSSQHFKISQQLQIQVQGSDKINKLKTQNIYQNNQTQNVMIKQVPIQVIVQQIVQLPPKIIIRQMPYQVIIQKIVVKQVPIQVIVEKEVIVDRIIIKQVPVEVAIQKEIFVDRIIIKEIPIQNIIVKEIPVQTIVIKEVPIQVVVEKEVFVDRIVVKQVPIQVIVEKQIFTDRVVIKQVPIQVYVEKEVFVDRIIVKQVPIQVVVEKEVIVQKIVELPPKIIIKQVPYEVIIEKEMTQELQTQDIAVVNLKTQAIAAQTIEQPQQIIIRQVPVQIIVQKEVFIDRTIIRQVPIQVIIEKQIFIDRQVFVDRIVIKQVPVEVIVQKEVKVQLPQRVIIKQVPTEVEVQKIVHVIHQIPIEVKKIQIRQVPIEVVVQREVIRQIPTFIQTPVQVFMQKHQMHQDKVIIKQVPYEVILTEYIQIPTEVIRQIPVEVIRQVEVIKIVKQIVQVPVIVYMEQQKKQTIQILQLGQQSEQKTRNLNAEVHLIEEPFENSKLMLESKQPHNNNEVQYIQTIVQKIVQKQVIKIKEVPIEVQVERQVIKLVQIPTEVVIIQQKHIPYETIVEVPVQVFISNPIFVQIPIEVLVEKPIIINKIVEVPIEVMVYQERVIEVPVEVVVYRDRLIEVPIEVIIYKDRIFEVPHEVIVQKIRQIPIQVQVQIIKVVQIPYEVIVQKIVQVQKIVYVQRQSSIKVQLQNEEEYKVKQQQLRSSPQVNNNQQSNTVQRVYNLPCRVSYENDQITYQIEIDGNELQGNNYEEIIVSLSYDSQQEQQSEKMLDKQSKANPLSPIIATKNAGTITDKYQQKVKIMEIPIQVQMIDLQSLKKDTQEKYRDYLADIKQNYQNQIIELHKVVANLQTVILQSNEERQELSQKIQKVALEHEVLQTQLEFFQSQTRQITQQLKEQIKLMKIDQQNKTMMIEQLNDQVRRLTSNTNSTFLQIRSNVIYELPIQIQIEKETSQKMIQTQDIRLQFTSIVMEIPVQLQLHDIIKEEQIQFIQQGQYQQHFKLNQKNLHAQANIIVQNGCQTIAYPKQRIIYELPLQINVDKQISFAQVQTLFTVEENEDLIVVRQMEQNPYETQISQNAKIINQPIIYEIATQIEVIKETIDTQMQTQPSILSNSSRGSSSEGEKLISEQQEQQYQYEQQFVKTQKNSKFSDYYKHQKAVFPFKKQKKPYSSSFTSRIFQIPIQLNLNKVSNSIQVQTQASDNKQSLLDDAGLSNMFISRQREIIVSHLRIIQAFEPYKIISQTKTTPRKIQNKIMSLGSQNDNLGVYQNFSNVQSLTPNQLDGSSSYDKFPMPNININNISLIKKSSIHSQGKFFGSLDMREELLNHDDPIASVRMANKKLAGFQRQESSSQGDVHNLSREMIIQQNQTIVSRQRDINRIQTPNLEPHDLNFSEYATLQEKMYQVQEEKINYHQLYQNCQNQLQDIKGKLQNKIEEISQLKIEIDRETSKYQEEIRKLNEQLFLLRKEVGQYQHTLDLSKIKIGQQQENKHKLQKKIEMLFQNWQKLKEQNQKSQNCLTKEIQRLRTIINQKIAQIKDLKADQHHHKEVFQGQLNQCREIINKKNEIIDNLEEQLQKSNDRNDQLVDSLQQMRKNINNHNNETDTAAIYEQQFERVKQSFEQEKKQLNYHIYELKQQIDQLKQTISDQIAKNQELQDRIIELQKEIGQTKHEYSSLHHLKSALQNNYMEGVKCLNQELQEMKDLVREKDQIIQHYNYPNLNNQLQHKDYSNVEYASKIRIEYLSKQTSDVSHQENIVNLEMHNRKLQNLLKKYERIIIDNQSTIEELQDKVYQYLKDALQKQQEAQGLYMKLVDYQNTINNILVQKVTLQIENKRLSKQIDLSQKKLNVLGNRLIEVARQRAQYQSDDDYYYD